MSRSDGKKVLEEEVEQKKREVDVDICSERLQQSWIRPDRPQRTCLSYAGTSMSETVEVLS